MIDVVMPRLSDSMEEGTILHWIKSVGDQVAVGDELVEIETDKANMVYESDAAGTLIEIVADEGETLPIGGVIARVGEAGEEPQRQGDGGRGRRGRRERRRARRARRRRRRSDRRGPALAAPEPAARRRHGGRPGQGLADRPADGRR